MSATENAVVGEGSFRGVRNRKIVWRSWSPAGDQPVQAVVTLAHGYGEHSGRYEYVASRLTAEGFAVYAPDHRGHGRSGGKRGRISFADAVADLDQLIVTVAKAQTGSPHSPTPQFLIGHSMGGTIALRYAIAHQDRLTGLVVTSPLAAVDGSAALQSIGKLVGLILPGAPVTRIDPRLVSRDHAVVKAYIADPLVLHGPLAAGTVREFVLSADSLPRDVKRITLPTLLLWGTADRLCPPRGAEAVAANIASSDLTAKPYEGLFHEIMNEPERVQVVDDIVGWLHAHLAATSAI